MRRDRQAMYSSGLAIGLWRNMTGNRYRIYQGKICTYPFNYSEIFYFSLQLLIKHPCPFNYKTITQPGQFLPSVQIMDEKLNIQPYPTYFGKNKRVLQTFTPKPYSIPLSNANPNFPNRTILNQRERPIASQLDYSRFLLKQLLKWHSIRHLDSFIMVGIHVFDLISSSFSTTHVFNSAYRRILNDKVVS